jgi:hypothetical protein
MKAGRVDSAIKHPIIKSVMMGCYDLQCTCSDVCMLQPYCAVCTHAKHDVSVDMDAAGHGMTDLERPRP